MCGIAGFFSLTDKPVVAEELQSMSTALWHRGPDDEGFYVRSNVGLGMRRLSIIDLQTGSQPVRNEDGSIWLVFNGEIYNFQQLRRDLENKGHIFYTGTDTEAIVHLYEDLGPRCVDKLRGMFTFAIWDSRRNRFMLARDRLGIKPLYYAEIGGRLLFASELKSILQLPEVDRQLNWSAVNHVFSRLCTPASESIIEGVHKLEPGHILMAEPGRAPAVQRYWDVHFAPDHSHDERWFVERLREELEESVRLHLVGDVPLGSFLSGGIDSSSVVALASRMTSQPLKTFSIGFAERAYSELDYARVVAERFGADHCELVLQPDVTDILDDLAWYLDEPFGDSSAIPTYMVSKLARERVTVVLSGDGGDELFAGYDKYLVEKRERIGRFLPSPLRTMLAFLSRAIPEGKRGHNFVLHHSLTGPERYLDASTLFRLEQKEKLFQPDAFRLISGSDSLGDLLAHFAESGGHWLSNLQRLDLKSYLPNDILTKVDRMSMANSIEARVPLLDHKVVEFALTIPPDLNLRDGTTKYILKKAMRGTLPDAVIDRPKQGFAIPLGVWFRGKLDGYVRDILLSERAKGRGILNAAYIEELLARHAHGRPLDLQLWTLISFELWCRAFLDRKAAMPRRPIVARSLSSERASHAA